jgi:hypothetical protein
MTIPSSLALSFAPCVASAMCPCPARTERPTQAAFFARSEAKNDVGLGWNWRPR